MNDIFHVMKIFRKTVLFAKNFYLQQELRGIMEVARSRGWQLELPQMYGLPGHVRNWHGAGLLTDTGYYTEKLRNEGVKIVGLSLDPVLLRTAGAVVAPDNARIGVAAAEYFLRHGYRRFAVCEDCFGRDLAFERRIAAEGVHAVRISMPRYFRSTLALKRVMERLSLLPTPCCIFCNNDWEASSVLNAAGMGGIKVPEHLAVLGVGNEELICSTASPQISSLDTRLYERGRRAAEELDRLMEGGDPRSSPILIPPGEVVERGSSSFYAVSNRTLGRILAGEDIGTVFLPRARRIPGRKRWISFFSRVSGSLLVDAGAARAVREQGRSLLPSGVKFVSGEFKRGDTVEIAGPDGVPFARGLVNFDAADCLRICGQSSVRVHSILGPNVDEELIHRDNLTLNLP